MKLLECGTEYAGVVVDGRLGWAPAYNLGYCLDRPAAQQCTLDGGACSQANSGAKSSCCSAAAMGADTCNRRAYVPGVRIAHLLGHISSP